MPVIISPDKALKWLNTDQLSVDGYLEMLQPYNAELMQFYPVSVLLNNARNNNPELLHPVEPQKSLF